MGPKPYDFHNFGFVNLDLCYILAMSSFMAWSSTVEMMTFPSRIGDSLGEPFVWTLEIDG